MMNIDQNAKKTHKSLKNEMFIFDYIQLLMIGQAIQAMKGDQNVKKDPLSHQKMKCLLLDYIQLLMMKCDRNVKK